MVKLIEMGAEKRMMHHATCMTNCSKYGFISAIVVSVLLLASLVMPAVGSCHGMQVALLGTILYTAQAAYGYYNHKRKAVEALFDILGYEDER
tara:strand:+ start:57 stop:335 length:279 start_codon:yes stop_codon:yes gene_type:complete